MLNRAIYPLSIAIAILMPLAPFISDARAGPGDPASAAAETRLRDAREMIAAGESDRAVALLREAVDLAPTLTDAWVHLGNTHLALGQTAQAVTAYRRALALDGGLQDVRYNLAYGLRQLSRYRDAVAVYRRYLQDAPKDADALFGLAESLQGDQQWAAAADAFEAYADAETRPNQAQWAARARMDAENLRKRAAPLEAARAAPAPAAAEPDGAEPANAEPDRSAVIEDPAPMAVELELEAIDEAVERLPSKRRRRRPLTFERGLKALQAGDFDGALKQLEAAVADADGDPVVLSALGSAHLGRQDAPAALTAYRTALGHRPSAALIPPIEFGMAEAFRLQGNSAAAVAALRRVVGHAQAPAALRKLAEARLAVLTR